MENNKGNNSGQKRTGQLLNELLESINRQLDVNAKLKGILERAVAVASRKREPRLTEEIISEIKDAVIEAQSLQAEERAVFHQLFGVEDE